MKTELGISVAVLSALAAQGKDFDRTELKKYLPRLRKLLDGAGK